MASAQGLLGLAAILAVAFIVSADRRAISIRTVGVGLALQFAFALAVLRWNPGRDALKWFAGKVASLIGYTNQGSQFLFGPKLAGGKDTIFAFQVLPVIIFLAALIGLLYYLRVVQYFVYYVGGAVAWLLRVTRIESTYAVSVIFLGMSEAPLLVAPYLASVSGAELYTIMSGGLAAVAGSTLIGYSLLGAPLTYLLAASVMNAPGALVIAKLIEPTRREDPEATRDPVEQDGAGEAPPDRGGAPAAAEEFDVRSVRDEESANIVDAIGRGAITGLRIAVTVGALLIAFIALIAMANGIISGVGGWFGNSTLTLQKVFGWIFAPVAWLIGVPWSEASTAGNFIGQKTVLNEFVAFTSFGPQVHHLSHKTVLVVTFALAGFANFASIAIQLGALGTLAPERRAAIARFGLKALLGGVLVNLANAAIAGIVAG